MLQTLDGIRESSAAEYLGSLSRLLSRVPSSAVDTVVELLLVAQASGRRVYVMGNGGSSATASHFVCDLVKTARAPGVPPLRAFALGDNAALLTAWANDESYERVFAQQIIGLVDDDDVVIAISASGNSPNILAGLRAATEHGARTVAFVGFDGGQACELADITVHVPAHDYGLVEDAHCAIGHAVASAVRKAHVGRME